MELFAFCNRNCFACKREGRLRYLNQISLRMRLTAILLLALSVHVSAKVNSQTISYSGQNVKLEKVFKELEKQTGFFVMINKELLDHANKVTVNVTDVAIEYFLKNILLNQDLDFTIRDKSIFIWEKKPAVSLNILASPSLNNPPITGIVRGPDGKPIAGANVIVKGTKKGTTTSADGAFNIDANKGDIIIISSIGYDEKQMNVSQSNIGTISLITSLSRLDEVQIIAYGTTTKRLNIGNVTSVKSETIQQQPVSNPLAALQGRVPGMVISQTTGMPGGGFKVQIRGKNSISNGNDPLYIVDGVPYSAQTLGSLNSFLQGGNPLNFINSSDIESIEILKDADATSIYGSRAASGVVLITTKKGKAGKMKISAKVYAGSGKVTRMMKLLQTPEYLKMRREAFLNDERQPQFYDYDVNGVWDTARNTNWQKVLLGNNANYRDAQLSLSGGNTNVQYLIGGGYHRESTVLPSDGSDSKSSFHFNINTNSENNKFKVSISGSYVSDINTTPLTDKTTNALGFAPNAPSIYNSDGTLNWAPIHPGEAGTWINPLADFQNKYKGKTNNLIGNAVFSYSVIKNLELKISLGYANMHTDEISKFPVTAEDPFYQPDITGSSQFGNSNIRSWIAEPQLNYKVKIAKGILSALAGASYQKNINDRQQLSASGFSSDALLENILAAPSVSVVDVTNTEYKYGAVFGRLSYNYQDKYLLNANIRRDGTSRFGPSKQFANFASIGAGWIFSSEDFIQQHFPVVSFGKLRASYGTSGNDQILDYQFFDSYSSTPYAYQGMQGLYPATLFNPELAWEVNRKFEIGLNIGFLKDRIIVEGNYYRNRSSNQLIRNPLSAVTGFTNITKNLEALVQNSGFEAVLTTINVTKKNFSWLSSFNITVPRNKLVAFPNLGNSSYSSLYVIGQPITIIKSFQYAGINDSSGIYQFIDSKGSIIGTPNTTTDYIVINNVGPKYYGGVQNTFRYKGISFDIFLQFIKQLGTSFDDARLVAPGQASNQPTYVMDRWQKQGDVAYLQKFTQLTSSQAFRAYRNMKSSNFIYEDASFIRIKNIALAWELPNVWSKRIKLESSKIYVNAQNLFTITKYRGFDPETQGVVLPPLRVITAGLQISL
jgi:TonB-dependent starch-binding outer membrane protein SusC